MAQKQLHRPKNGFLRRTVRNVGKALMVVLPLTAGLLLLSPKADAQNKKPGTEIKRTTKKKMGAATAVEKSATGIGCRTPAGVKSGKLAVGQEMWFGVTWRAMYKMEVTKLTKDKVKYDLTVPIGIPIAGINIVSYSAKFNGIEASRSEVEQLAQLICTTGKKVVPKKAQKTGKTVGVLEEGKVGDEIKLSRKKGSELLEMFTIGEKGKEGSVTESTENMLSRLVGRMFKNLTVLTVRGEVMLVKTSAFSGSVAPLQVKVIGRNSKEFRLQVKAKGSKPMVVRLDRNITQNVEFITDKAGLIATPFRIASLSIDKKGKVKGTLKVDCSKKVYMEIFMSEHSATHPYCRPCEIKRTTKKGPGVGVMLDLDGTGTKRLKKAPEIPLDPKTLLKPTKKAKSGVGVMLE